MPHTPSPAPIPDSYWLVDGRLLAGEYPGAKTPERARQKLEPIIAAGIRTFVDLTEARDPLEPYAGLIDEIAAARQLDLRHKRFGVRDLGVPRPELMRDVLAAIRAELAEERPVYFHCWGGIGRTGTVAGCWLVEQGHAPAEALARIATLRTTIPSASLRSPETDEQRAFIHAWAARPASSTSSSRSSSTTEREDPYLDRCVGALVGLAVGDALGTTLEFKRPGTFEPIRDMVGGGPFDLRPGEWTDDTSMALCLGESLLEHGFDPADQLRRYVRWYRDGYFSSTGRCFDIGNTVRSALHRFEGDGDPARSGMSHPASAGNGSIMRLAPVPIRYAAQPAEAIDKAGASSKTTHAHPEAVDGCRYLAAVVLGALQGRSKEEILGERFTPVPGVWQRAPLANPIDDVAAGSFHRREPPEIRGTGYVTASLEAALWTFASSSTFEEGALLAVNLGDDADTTGAVYGQIAGAFYGAKGIPAAWRQRIAMRETIESMAHRLAAAGRPAPRPEKG